ncbi:MAG: sel1 repeat family protein [Clostridiales bacterium]|jgi:hypothetical protein|nr:sel1 repeat family protein [Clostridiales bacterium]MCR5201434.1 hypothetical protein [Saccharofermentans sp.]
MDQTPRVIKISEYSLDSFAVFDSDFYDITLLPLAATKNIVLQCDTSRDFTLDDMAQVLEKIIGNGMDAASFFFTWFEPLMIHFYDLLNIKRLYGDSPSSIETYRLNMMPQTDDDLLSWILSDILRGFRELSLIQVHLKASDYIDAENLLHMIDLQEEEGMLPIEDRHYIEAIKDDFIHELDNDLILKEADRFTKKLFIKYVNDLCEIKNFNALRIKGFACLGGNSVFRSDFREAARCMEILWKDGGFGYAANTLGFIHLEGRLNDGIPDYGKAFHYFSIGHAFGISESTYKLAEMFIEGVYVSKNTEMAASLIEKVYVDARYRFEQEEFECGFAEAAMHMGQLQLKVYNDNPESFRFMREQALDFFLQAEFAIMMRSQFGVSPADKKLHEIIKDRINELSSDIKLYKARFRSDYPGPIKDFLSYRPYGSYRLIVKHLKNDKVKITVRRITGRSDTAPACTLLTYREFRCCSLTDEVTITANNATSIVKDDAEGLVFDDISIETTQGGKSLIRFYLGQKICATISAESFTISKP